MAFPTDFSPDETMLVYELSSSSMWHKEGVVYIYPKAGIGHNISRAKEQTSIFQEKIVEQDKQYALICDIRHSDPIGKECRDYYVSDTATRNVSSFSFLVDSKFSMVHRLTGFGEISGCNARRWSPLYWSARLNDP